MFQHPDFAIAHAHDKRRDFVARADRYRLSSALRRRNRAAASHPAAQAC
jgi:hypothetical protein